MVLSKTQLKNLVGIVLFSAGTFYLVLEVRKYLDYSFHNAIGVGIGLILVSVLFFGKEI